MSDFFSYGDHIVKGQISLLVLILCISCGFKYDAIEPSSKARVRLELQDSKLGSSFCD